MSLVNLESIHCNDLKNQLFVLVWGLFIDLKEVLHFNKHLYTDYLDPPVKMIVRSARII